MFKEKINQKISFFLIMIIMLSSATYAQISQGGLPYSLSTMDDNMHNKSLVTSLTSNIPIITMPYVNNDSLLSIGSSNYDAESYDFAIRFDRSINIKKNAAIDSLPEGKLYRCAIESPTAYSVHLVFNNFHIPIGAKLFLYDESAKQILGAFTSNNNKKSHVFAVAPIFSNKIIVEYFEPYFAEFEGIVEIGQVYHGYIDISRNIETSSLDGTCEVDVNCSEGANWQREKHAVCRIIFGGAACSGALINNTNYDGTPYFLTANHCISSESTANICIFYFNYENTTCGVNGITSIQTLSGASLKATSPNTDFTLLELSEMPGITFQPYYAGWDRNISHGEGGVGIHHPLSLPKKISTYEMAPKLNSCQYAHPNNFYLIDEWVETEHGYGVTEGGSSGSPLFNNKHRIIGQLYGGCTGHNSNCDNPSNDYSVYGKFYLSWDTGSSSTTRLKDWLDPANKDYMYVNGLGTCSNSEILDIGIHHSVDEDGVVALYSKSYIESTAILDSGSIVSYVANDYIRLKNGFQAKKGTEFRASISNTLCNSFAPMSITNWNPNLSNGDEIKFNVTNATRYKIFVHSLSGELIYTHQDTILSNNVIVCQTEQLLDSIDKYLVTIAFENRYEEVSNTYILDCDRNDFSRKQVKNPQYGKSEILVSDHNLDFNLYPNPATEFMEIEVLAEKFIPYIIRIYTLSGQCISALDYINTNKINMNVNNLPQGEYALQIVMGKYVRSKKFLKK